MNIESAKYRKNMDGRDSSIIVIINGLEYCVPNIESKNRYYRELMRQVDAGELTIEPSDE
tara:strand:- start:41 stop:220 length:180 start_codon:yes stop_codon:yes gene_type:complete